ncbi:MAG: septum formation initiator family protein [Gammaproteobacteria bacterium]|nr:septum formation initiator family protein [Gammaproteobacteria bacterium]
MLRKIIIVLLVILFVILQYQLWGGSIKLFYLKRAIAKETSQNDQFYKRNELLRQRVQALQQHKISVEDLAREQLGMVKKGEVYYQVVEKNQTHKEK